MLADGRTSAAAVVPLSSQQENQIAPAVHRDDDFFARSKLTSEQLTAAAAREKVLRSVLALPFNDLAAAQAIRRDYGLALDFIDRLSIGTQRWQGLKRTSVNALSQ